MKKYKYIDSFPKPFLNDLVSSRCLPFIGAGFSKNADIPKGKKMLNWDELGQRVAADIKDYQYSDALDALSAYCHEYSRSGLIETLTGLLLVHSAKAGKAHKAFCDLQFDIVCTTNFEFLLEEGYSLVSKTIHPIINEDQLPIASPSDSVTLLKIHGDLHHPTKMVVTEDDYDRFLTVNPMLATFLTNLLITKTPLFIGYSLDDVDFRQIWQVIKERLGTLRRQAYTIKVDCSTQEQARFLRRGVKVINLKGNPADYPSILEDVFVELKDYWNYELLKRYTISEEAMLSELELPEDTNNRLCFFSIPIKLIPFYKKHIFPIVKSLGLVPLSADDVISEGDNWMAKVSALINKAEFVVVDLGTKNTIFELGLVLNQKKGLDRVLVIAPQLASLPADMQRLLHITRSDDPFEDIDDITYKINSWLEQALLPVKPQYEEEPRRLMIKREYKAAVIAAMTLLEIHIREVLNERNIKSIKSFTSLYSLALESQLITERQYQQIMTWSRIRSHIIHTKEQVTVQRARQIVNGVYEVLREINRGL